MWRVVLLFRGEWGMDLNDKLVVLSSMFQQFPGSLQVVKVTMKISQQHCYLRWKGRRGGGGGQEVWLSSNLVSFPDPIKKGKEDLVNIVHNHAIGLALILNFTKAKPSTVDIIGQRTNEILTSNFLSAQIFYTIFTRPSFSCMCTILRLWEQDYSTSDPEPNQSD